MVLLEVTADEDELRTELARLAARHAALRAERLGLVGRCQHHAATDRDRLAAQARIEELLDRGIEGVQIGMEDGGRHGPRSRIRNTREQFGWPVKPRALVVTHGLADLRGAEGALSRSAASARLLRLAKDVAVSPEHGGEGGAAGR